MASRESPSHPRRAANRFVPATGDDAGLSEVGYWPRRERGTDILDRLSRREPNIWPATSQTQRPAQSSARWAQAWENPRKFDPASLRKFRPAPIRLANPRVKSGPAGPAPAGCRRPTLAGKPTPRTGAVERKVTGSFSSCACQAEPDSADNTLLNRATESKSQMGSKKGGCKFTSGLVPSSAWWRHDSPGTERTQNPGHRRSKRHRS